MGVNKVVFNNKTLIDISDSTVSPETLVEGEVAYSSNGEKISGALATMNNSCTLLGYYTRSNSATETVEEYTLTLSESIDNFAMIHVGVASTVYVVGSSMISVPLFKTKLPGVSEYSHFELNYINDQSDLFGGNIKYSNNTCVSGKIVGKTQRIWVYGIGRINAS